MRFFMKGADFSSLGLNTWQLDVHVLHVPLIRTILTSCESYCTFLHIFIVTCVFICSRENERKSFYFQVVSKRSTAGLVSNWCANGESVFLQKGARQTVRRPQVAAGLRF